MLSLLRHPNAHSCLSDGPNKTLRYGVVHVSACARVKRWPFLSVDIFMVCAIVVTLSFKGAIWPKFGSMCPRTVFVIEAAESIPLGDLAFW